jgi:hypothetical protein
VLDKDEPSYQAATLWTSSPKLAGAIRGEPPGSRRPHAARFFEHRKDDDWLGMYRFVQAHCADGAVSTAEIYCLSMMYNWIGRAVLVMAR